MAKTKESTTPKAKEAKETKPAKAGIAKRTPVRALPVKLSRAKSVVPSEDMLFMWKIMQVSVMEPNTGGENIISKKQFIQAETVD
ncbi:hypothetical protein NUH16_004014 [Penicillium rubens]|nr:hypothetical protein NUH16_004014 [Penicillium rubens]